jgi:hypothetical protein
MKDNSSLAPARVDFNSKIHHDPSSFAKEHPYCVWLAVDGSGGDKFQGRFSNRGVAAKTAMAIRDREASGTYVTGPNDTFWPYPLIEDEDDRNEQADLPIIN